MVQPLLRDATAHRLPYSRLFGWLLVAALAGACARRVPETEPEPAPISEPTEADAEQLAELIALVTYPEFGDSDPVDWDERTPQTYPVHGIDVSRWQGDIDWAKARSSGVSFAYIKATEGGDFVDPKFSSYWKGSKSAGMRRGAYHYYYFCRTAAEQAKWFIRNVPRDDDALPHVLDMEWNPRSKTCSKRPEPAKVRAEAKRFIDILEDHYGRRPIIYTTVDFYKDTGIGKLKGTEFWLRSVAGHPREVYPRAVWSFWQYTGTGKVPGINGEVDLNVFRSTPKNWVRWANGSK